MFPQFSVREVSSRVTSSQRSYFEPWIGEITGRYSEI